MIMKPTMMIINEKSNRKILMDRFYARHKLVRGTPCLISRATPDVLLWKRRNWIVPYNAEKVTTKKVVKKKK